MAIRRSTSRAKNSRALWPCAIPAKAQYCRSMHTPECSITVTRNAAWRSVKPSFRIAPTRSSRAHDEEVVPDGPKAAGWAARRLVWLPDADGARAASARTESELSTHCSGGTPAPCSCRMDGPLREDASSRTFVLHGVELAERTRPYSSLPQPMDGNEGRQRNRTS